MKKEIEVIKLNDGYQMKVNVITFSGECAWEVIAVELEHPNSGWVPWFSIIENCTCRSFASYSAADETYIRKRLSEENEIGEVLEGWLKGDS